MKELKLNKLKKSRKNPKTNDTEKKIIVKQSKNCQNI